MTGSHSRHLLALLLFLFLTGLLTLPARLHVGDPYAWRAESINLILHARLNVPEVEATTHGEPEQYFILNQRDGRYYSKYGVMNSLLNVVPLLAEYSIHKSLPPWDSEYRRLYLGLFSLAIALLIAWLLFRICLHYTPNPSIAVLYVLLACFTTYLHYYFRASNTEATQLLFFLAWFERVLRFKASGYRDNRHLLWGWFFVLCLVLTKISFLLLVPLAVLPALLRPNRFRLRALLELAIPCLLIVAAMALVNYLRFGSAFHTGYTWAKEDLSQTLPAWRIIPNLFFDTQWGLPTHFPLLFLFPFGARHFFRAHRLDSYFILMLAVAFLLAIGRLPIWRGEWSYGPRYFLFLLPVLCLPALSALEAMLEALRKKSKAALLGVVAAGLLFGYSAQLQFEVARLDPFFYYWVRPPVMCDHDPKVKIYFATTHFGRFNAEFWKHRDQLEKLWWLQSVARGCPPEVFEAYAKNISLWINRTNFYWFSPRD